MDRVRRHSDEGKGSPGRGERGEGWGAGAGSSRTPARARGYRRQTDVGDGGQPEVDVVRVAEVQAGRLQGRERARLQFSGRPPRRAQTAACRLEELGEPEAPAPRPGQTQTDGHHRVGVRQDAGVSGAQTGLGTWHGGPGAGRGGRSGGWGTGSTAWGWSLLASSPTGGLGDPRARPASVPCCYGQRAAPGREPPPSTMTTGTPFVLGASRFGQ